MSQFEYVMVMVALILALALAQALRGLSEIATSRHRYLPHALWLVGVVFLMVQGWWADWDLNAVDEWRFSTYLLTLAFPMISFAGVHLLVPESRDDNFDWRERFFAVKQWFFGLHVVYMLMAIAQSALYTGTPLAHPYRLFQVALIGTFVTGMVSKHEAVQKLLPVLFITVVVTSQIIVRMDIGALMID